MNSEEVNSAQDEEGWQKCLFRGTLALFFRVMLSEKEEEGQNSLTRIMPKLVESLMRIISCCYSIEVKSNVNTNPRRYVKLTIYMHILFHWFNFASLFGNIEVHVLGSLLLEIALML